MEEDAIHEDVVVGLYVRRLRDGKVEGCGVERERMEGLANGNR